MEGGIELVQEGLLTVGELSELAGITPRTLRFYEEQELVKPDLRSAGGYRLYSTDQLKRLEMIATLKALGAPLNQIREILDMRDAGHRFQGVAAQLEAKILAQIAEVSKKIELYQKIKEDLERSLNVLHECCGCKRSVEDVACKLCESFNFEGRPPRLLEAILS